MSIDNKKRPPVSSITAVLFDLDDTLLDSFYARVRALQVVFTQAKIVGVKAERFLNNLQGSQLKESLELLAETQNVKIDLFVAYRRAYWFKKPGCIRLYPGVKKMLDTLKSRGYIMGIVTNKGRDFGFGGSRVGCVYELQETGIADLFSTVVGFEDVNMQKPHPQCINLALHNLGIKPPQALVVGDSVADIEAARSAGCLSCRAAWGIASNAADAAGSAADFIASSPDEVIRIITGNS